MQRTRKCIVEQFDGLYYLITALSRNTADHGDDWITVFSIMAHENQLERYIGTFMQTGNMAPKLWRKW